MTERRVTVEELGTNLNLPIFAVLVILQSELLLNMTVRCQSIRVQLDLR